MTRHAWLADLLSPQGLPAMVGNKQRDARVAEFIHSLRTTGYVIAVTRQQHPSDRGHRDVFHLASRSERDAHLYFIGRCDDIGDVPWHEASCPCFDQVDTATVERIADLAGATRWAERRRVSFHWAALTHSLARIHTEHSPEVFDLAIAATDLDDPDQVKNLEAFAQAVSQALTDTG